MDIKTPHINAPENGFAKTVLMPGDPLRSKFIAENFLENAILINDVRGVQGYTGTYKGKRITVMASGMGMPSMGIYSYELYKYCNVENIIRIGSAGALKENIELKSIIIGKNSLTNTNYNGIFYNNIHSIKCSDKLLNETIYIANNLNLNYLVGNLYSTDTFYNDQFQSQFMKKDAIAVEMESAALYDNANKLGKNAITIVTISDNIITNESCSAIERQNSFTEMMKLALELAIRMDDNV